MLPKPDINEIKGPSGPDIAAKFGSKLTITYWDFWCLLVAQSSFDNDLHKLRNALVDQRLNKQFWGSYPKELVEDLIALVADLKERMASIGTVEKILSYFPEKLIKKEAAKAKRNVLEQDTSYPPSEPMLKSPRRLLEKEAYRGMWFELPINPTPFAEALRPLLIPKKKMGYFPKGTTFALSRRVEKAFAKELKPAKDSANPEAYQYAVFRAGLTLFHEQHHWDDSYGVMGDLGTAWLNAILKMTPTSTAINPRVFLKDLLMFLCWEVYGLSESEQIIGFVKNLKTEEKAIGIEILKDVEQRANQGFQDYHGERATKLLSQMGSATSGNGSRKLKLIQDSARVDL